MGQQVLLQGANFVDEKYPVLQADQRLNNGSLLLLDLSHSLNNISGVPSNSAVIPNIAHEISSGIVGGGDAQTLGVKFITDATSSTIVLERTSKGALHGIVSDTARNEKTAGFKLDTSSNELFQYLKANKNRNYAVFLWAYVTRQTTAIGNINDTLGFVNTASAAGNNMLGGSVPNTQGLQRLALNAPTGFSGSLNADDNLNNGFPFFWGQTPPYSPLNPNKGKSMILYAYHLIDVELSGKTYAELNAIDAALFNQYFSVGGRFYNDTWSDPASVLA